MFKVASIEIPEYLPGEQVYSLLFQADPEPRPDYAWMNPKPRPHKAKETEGIREYRLWIKSGL